MREKESNRSGGSLLPIQRVEADGRCRWRWSISREEAGREGGRQNRSFGLSRRVHDEGRWGESGGRGESRGREREGRAERENRFDRFDSHLPDHVAPAYVRTLCIMQPGCMCNA